MLEAILNSNPFALLAVGVVVVFVLMFIFVRPDKKKSNKSGTTASAPSLSSILMIL